MQDGIIRKSTIILQLHFKHLNVCSQILSLDFWQSSKHFAMESLLKNQRALYRVLALDKKFAFVLFILANLHKSQNELQIHSPRACTWTIKTWPGHQIQIEFHQFRVTDVARSQINRTHCITNYLTVSEFLRLKTFYISLCCSLIVTICMR